jgi:hypothetical protein
MLRSVSKLPRVGATRKKKKKKKAEINKRNNREEGTINISDQAQTYILIFK